MERQRRAALNLYAPDGFGAHRSVELPAEAAHHARVRRTGAGDAVRLLDGKGSRADATIESLTKNGLTVHVGEVVEEARPTPLHVLVPVADRDRMLFAAEKCAELGVTSWRPVLWERSRSVSPRGEGAKFREKVLARMVSALEQSANAWLPDIHTEVSPAQALEAIGANVSRFILDASGTPLSLVGRDIPVAIAVGPEGGFEPAELELADRLGWRATSVSASTLRFETAVIAGAAIVRAQHTHFGRA